jgi:hypothetical protein
MIYLQSAFNGSRKGVLLARKNVYVSNMERQFRIWKIE